MIDNIVQDETLKDLNHDDFVICKFGYALKVWNLPKSFCSALMGPLSLDQKLSVHTEPICMILC